jgi:hypothetical protein
MADVGQIDTENQIATNGLPLDAEQSDSLPPKKTLLLDLEQFRSLLRKSAHDVGGQAELGRRLNVSGQFIGFVINGKNAPGPKLLSAFGARRKTMIEIEVEAE